MKNYTITVNGYVYDVIVEEKEGGVSAPSAPKKAPQAPAQPKPAPAAAVGKGAGNVKIEAGAAGKVFKLEAAPGQTVKTGDPILVLEIMKMETPVVAPSDGVVASIDVSVGQSVEAGEVLATLN